VFVPDYHLSVFSIKSSMNIHDFSFFIHNEWRFISEELPPSWVDSILIDHSTSSQDFQCKELSNVTELLM
jgi:hypothetical protein